MRTKHINSTLQPGQLCREATVETQKGNLDGALALLQKTIAQDYYAAEAFPLLIKALFRAKRERDAEALAIKILKAFPDTLQVLHIAVETFHRTKNAPRFQACYQLIMNSAAVYKLFKTEFAAGKFEAAFEKADTLNSAAKHFEAKRFLNLWGDDTGSGEAVKTMLEQKLRGLEKITARGKTSPWYYFFKATLLFRSENPELKKLCKKIRSFDPKEYGWMRAICGKASLHACDLAAARKDFEAALCSRPREWMTRCMLAETLACEKKSGEAFVHFDRALDETPEAAGEILSWKGEIQLWAGQYGEAASTLDRAVKAGAAWAYCWRGAAKLKTGDLNGAISDLETGLKSCRFDAEAYCWLGEAYRLKGKTIEALRYLDKSIALNFNAWAYANRALIKAAQKDKAGFERDFGCLPAPMVAAISVDLKLGKKSPDFPQKQQVLSRCFALSRGNRRPRSYELLAWLP